VSALVATTEGAVRTLRLNRPEHLNALDAGLRGAVGEALGAAAADQAVRVVIITGTGDRAFCAGQDLDESGALGGGEGGGWIATWAEYFAAFLDFPKPLVGAANGVAAGAGFETLMFCDIRVSVGPNRFIMSEVDVGLPTLIGSAMLDLHLGRARMSDLVLSGRAASAEEMRDGGFIHHLAAAPELAERTRAVAAELAAKPAVAMRLDVGRFRALLRERFRREATIEAMTRYQVEAIASGQPQRAMAEFLARRRRARS
jgi:enoyl-CoA hydratase/carnithine racemase